MIVSMAFLTAASEADGISHSGDSNRWSGQGINYPGYSHLTPVNPLQSTINFINKYLENTLYLFSIKVALNEPGI